MIIKFNTLWFNSAPEMTSKERAESDGSTFVTQISNFEIEMNPHGFVELSCFLSISSNITGDAVSGEVWGTLENFSRNLFKASVDIGEKAQKESLDFFGEYTFDDFRNVISRVIIDPYHVHFGDVNDKINW